MHLLLIFLLLFIENFAKTVEIKCPSYCKCDIYEQLKRAVCVNERLVNIEANLPKKTEILDLSYNQISKLNDGIFIDENLLSLKLLNLSHNKVGEIHYNAFDKMDNLRTLDLSYNAVQYLLPHWFWSLKSLQEVYLRGNSFQRFTDGPRFESKTIKKLDLSFCQIEYVGNDTFVKTPALEMLDLSDNNLLDLDVTVIKPLHNLTFLNIEKNPLTCRNSELTKFCRKKGIRLKTSCEDVKNKTEKFERIVNAAPDPVQEQNSWIFDDDEDKNKTVIVEVCSNSTKTDKKNLLEEIIGLSPILSITIPFIYGIAVGILIGCVVNIPGRRHENTSEPTYVSYDEGGHLRRRSSIFGRKARDRGEAAQSLVMSEWNMCESTPMAQRKNQVPTASLIS